MSELPKISDIDWSQWQPMEEGWEHAPDVFGRICIEQPPHANHFIARIVKDDRGYVVTCRCGVTFRLDEA